MKNTVHLVTEQYVWRETVDQLKQTMHPDTLGDQHTQALKTAVIPKYQIKTQYYELIETELITPPFTVLHSSFHWLLQCSATCIFTNLVYPLILQFPKIFVVSTVLSTSRSHGEQKLAAKINPCGLTILISKYCFFFSSVKQAAAEGTARKGQPTAFH